MVCIALLAAVALLNQKSVNPPFIQVASDQKDPQEPLSANFFGSCQDLGRELQTQSADQAKLAEWFARFQQWDSQNQALYQAENQTDESDVTLLKASLKAKTASCHFLRRALIAVQSKDPKIKQDALSYLKRAHRAPGLMSLKVDLEILEAAAKNKLIPLSAEQSITMRKLKERVSTDIQSMIKRMEEIGPTYQEFLKALAQDKSEAEAPVLQSAELKAQAQKFILNERAAQAEYFKLVDTL